MQFKSKHGLFLIKDYEVNSKTRAKIIPILSHVFARMAAWSLKSPVEQTLLDEMEEVLEAFV